MENISIIMRQTDYTEEMAIQKLEEFNNDYVKVIKDYLGISEKKVSVTKSVNQEIYKQLRGKLDESIKTYNLQQEEKLKIEIASNSNFE